MDPDLIKKIFKIFPINTAVSWKETMSGDIAYGIVVGYSYNSVGDIIVECKTLENIYEGKESFVKCIHPENRYTRLTNVVDDSNLWYYE